MSGRVMLMKCYLHRDREQHRALPRRVAEVREMVTCIVLSKFNPTAFDIGNSKTIDTPK